MGDQLFVNVAPFQLGKEIVDLHEAKMGKPSRRGIAPQEGASRESLIMQAGCVKVAAKPARCSALDNSVSCAETMTIKEHDCVVLTADLPSERLKAGDVGTVVHIHNAGSAYEVEFMTFAGNTIAVATVDAAALRPVGERDLSHVRELQSV